MTNVSIAEGHAAEDRGALVKRGAVRANCDDLAGVIDHVRMVYLDGIKNIVFPHTGGRAALFLYPDNFDLP